MKGINELKLGKFDNQSKIKIRINPPPPYGK